MYETTLFGLFWHLKRFSLWVYCKTALMFLLYTVFLGHVKQEIICYI